MLLRERFCKLILSLLAVGLVPCKAIAQIQPDSTLGAENSQVTTAIQDGIPTANIAGGAVRGSNLFHSFEQFSVPAGEAVLFRSDGAIANIFSRVTGGEGSSLDGRLAVEGRANLFVLNSAGIVIGPNAQLDLGGSFTASAAEGFRFADGFIYNSSANNSGLGGVTAAPPLLTVSAPVGIAWGDRPSPIQVFGQSPDPAAGLDSGLKVTPGQELSLSGGGIVLDGATLQAAGGKISLLSSGDIWLANQSMVDVSGVGGGEIEVEGQEIILTERSALSSDTFGEVDGKSIRIEGDRLSLQDGSFIGAITSGLGNANNIKIITYNDVEVIGTNITNFKVLGQLATVQGKRNIFLRTGGISSETNANGNAGNVQIKARNLLLDNGALIAANTLGSGNGGNIEINTRERIDLTGSGITSTTAIPGVPIFDGRGAATGISSAGMPAGDAGHISISTGKLLVSQGSSISTVTLSDGNAGDIAIEAIKSIEIQDFFDLVPIPTEISANTYGGNGNGGNIQINTGHLVVKDGAFILASSGGLAFAGEVPFGGTAGNITLHANELIEVVGNRQIAGPSPFQFSVSAIDSQTRSSSQAGNIQIRTPALRIKDGGRITNSTSGKGSGGSIFVDAKNILISGDTTSSNNNLVSGIFSSSGGSEETSLRLESSATTAQGQGGTIRIHTQQLAIQSRGAIFVDGFRLGPAGNLNIQAEEISLDNGGRLTARTLSGEGGNINLDITLLLQLRNGSEISATAEGSGNGGNINFRGGIILAVPGENSDFIANAFEGQGGRINLLAQNILGLTPTSGLSTAELRRNTTNDISANSELGTSGEVRLQNLAVNPEQGLAELPGEPLRGDQLIGQNICSTGPQRSEFLVTGRGGVPAAPTDTLSTLPIWEDGGQVVTQAHDHPSSWVEAQHWGETIGGKVVLYAVAPTSVQTRSPSCQTIQEVIHTESPG